MAESEKLEKVVGSANDKHVSPQKRKWDEEEKESTMVKMSKVPSEPVSGKIAMSIGKKAEPSKSPASGKLAGPVGKKTGIAMSLGGGQKSAGVAPIKLALNSTSTKETAPVKPKSGKIASVFNEDSESEEEEMPMEAKMRMKNVGRETKTAAGPNSFGKGNLGFCDRTKMIERELKRQMDELAGQDNT